MGTFVGLLFFFFFWAASLLLFLLSRGPPSTSPLAGASMMRVPLSSSSGLEVKCTPVGLLSLQPRSIPCCNLSYRYESS